MPNQVKDNFLKEIKIKFSHLKKLSNSQSLFEIGDGLARIYIRYSKVHNKKQAFYGLRKEDLKQLEGYNSFICFLFEEQSQPIFIPYSDFEEIFHSVSPSSDGQIKSSIFLQNDTLELYISNAGRFNIESYIGWFYFSSKVGKKDFSQVPDLTHSQVQSIIATIGMIKGFDIWIPYVDRNKLNMDSDVRFEMIKELPNRYDKIIQIVREIDIIWLQRGSSKVSALFEVEHSTPIYSGLLRFNDLHIIEPSLRPRYSIVSNDSRREQFFRQINRPTFQVSGLREYCNFLNYRDVFSWHKRILGEII